MAPTLCLLLPGSTIPQWQASALAHLLEHTDATVTAVGYNGLDESRSPVEALRRVAELREWAVVGAIDEWARADDASGQRVPITSVCDVNEATTRTIEPAIVDGWKQRLPAEPIEALAAESTVCIRFGFGFIVGPVLSAFDNGVLSYHHGDLREYRGQPMGFWEFVEGAETAGVTVQQLTDELDAGRVAARKTVPIADCRTWGAVKRRLYDASTDMLTDAVRAVVDGETHPPRTLGEVYTLPKGKPVAVFALKSLGGHLLERVRGRDRRPTPTD